MTTRHLDLSRAGWRKSTYSNNGGACVEVAAVWRKSTYSNNGGNCVEVALGRPDVIAVRDSKDPDGPKLAFTPYGWRRFASRVRSGAR
jgi:Domain of unknown function (DUF397)